MLKKIMASLGNLVVVIGVLVLAVFVVLSFFNTSKANEKIAALDVSIREHGKQIKAMTEENKAWAEENRVLVEKIEKLKQETKENSVAITKGVAEAQRLANNRPPAPVECKEIIEYMQKEIDAYVYNFSLAIRDRDTWKTIAQDFDLAYQNQVKVTVNLQTAVNLINQDSILKDEIIKDLKKDLAIRKIKGSLIAGGMVAVIVAAVIFGMLK